MLFSLLRFLNNSGKCVVYPVSFLTFPTNLGHCRPPLPWWQVVVVEYLNLGCYKIGTLRVEIYVYCYFVLTGTRLKCSVFPAKQPPPATVTMVAGGGDLILYSLMSHVDCLNLLSSRLSRYAKFLIDSFKVTT